ncbi:serine/threonine protein kinase [Nocardia yunnanensis]|uniref:non-specific serine/threonine protein kinase n=1 Tax=Nocardia yunnanensis TaxID=2382165 RepID=A0A386ZIR2_9NOCA|nr:serine/threonine protein kinase [Nocardia yunnanensis]
MDSPHHPLTVGSRFGPYRLDRLIGRGGMGEVYQAYDTIKDRTVAIKVLPERLAEDAVYRQRFQRESHAAARLREAHVIPIHDYGEIDGRLYIDMRLVDGDSLRSLLHRHGPGTPADAVAVVEQVAAALDAAHRDGLLHRDVKPDNILLTHEGFVYLVDFGIAQSVTDESLTQDGGAVGSYRYMAPERFAAGDIGPASDVYALTCVLFECLTGTRPFAGGNEAQIMGAHLFDPIPKPSLVRPTVPAAFDAVVARGMAKEPGQRYGTAGELAAAARAALPDRTGGRTSTNPPAPHPEMMETVTGTGRGNASDPGPGTGAEAVSGHPAEPGRRASRTRRRLRRLAAVAGVALLVAASLSFAGWAYRQHTTPGRPISDSLTLQPSDIEVLSIVSGTGYHRANCLRADSNTQGTSFILCDPNPAASAPAARFFRFRTAQAMHDYFTTTYLGGFGATSCPSDPAGKDGPLMAKGKEVGRKACYADRSLGKPAPGLVVTDEAEMVLSVYIFDNPELTALRDYWAKNNWGRLSSRENSGDPDVFTDDDRSLFKHLNDPYIARNCRHADPPLGPTAALVSCDNASDMPSVTFLGYHTTEMAKTVYQADIGQLSGHSCTGGGSKDEVWKRNGTPIGRYFCLTDTTGELPHQDLVAIYEDLHILVQLDGAPTDQPTTAPKTEGELDAWFQKNFTS